MSITVLIPDLLLVTIFYIMVREEPNDYYTFMFQLSECARRCSPALLNELLVKNKQPELSTKIDKKALGDAFVKIVLAAEPSAQEDIEIELRNVQDMTGGASVRLLTERAFASTHTLPDKFDEFSNYDKALWLRMHAPDLFREAATDCEIEDAKSWITYRVPLVDKATVVKKTKEVSELVCTHYQPRGRARFCHSDPIEKENYVGMAAYPLNHARSEDGYDAKGALETKYVATAFEIYFLYIPIESENIAYLSIKVKDGGGGNTDAEVLAKLFAENVLGKKDLNESDRVKYNLNKLQDINVVFDDFDDADMIDNVKVASVVLYSPAFPATITLRSHTKSGSINMSDIADCLRRLNIQNLNGFNIVHAEMKFKFKKSEKSDWKSKGLVPVKINTNRQSSCNLGINAQHMTVRKYLRKWGIEGK